MELQEYQAKKLLLDFGLPIPPFWIVKKKEEVEQVVREHALSQAVVKAQVLAGGRGKAGGVKLVSGEEEIIKAATAMLGTTLITKQTGKKGIVVHEVMLTTPISIAKEFYLSIVLDRKRGCFSLIASPEGGVDIETTAEKTPHKIKVIDLDISKKLHNTALQELIQFLGLPTTSSEMITKLIEAFFHFDCLLLEVNPLVLTDMGEVVLLDAKMSVDDNALFRQKKVATYANVEDLPPLEAKAKEQDLSYIPLDGTIGCMVNGAGLAMATMDLILYWGGKPANFLDVGGGANVEKVEAGFQIILSDKNVKAILVNIFGGIMNCETIATALYEAVKKTALKLPLVVRMEGTNAVKAREILNTLLPQVIIAQTLDEAAELVVKYGNTAS